MKDKYEHVFTYYDIAWICLSRRGGLETYFSRSIAVNNGITVCNPKMCPETRNSTPSDS